MEQTLTANMYTPVLGPIVSEILIHTERSATRMSIHDPGQTVLVTPIPMALLYNKNGYEKALAKIDKMDTEDVKSYIKKLIKDDMILGIQIIKNSH